MLSLSRIVVFGVAFGFVACGGTPDEPSVPTDPEALASELIRRSDSFQTLRREIMQNVGPGRTGDPEAGASLLEMDRQNVDWLKRVVDLHGWPRRSEVGDDAAQAAWLLIQHTEADPSFQKEALQLLSYAAEAGEASWRSVAYLHDRVMLDQGFKQRFGTQLDLSTGTPVPFPIENEEEVDARRALSGLPPMAEYLRVVEEQLSRGSDPRP